MINSSEIRKKLAAGEWYSCSPDHHIRWRILRVYGDDSIAKQYYDRRTGISGLCKMQQFDLKFTQLAKMFESGKMVFV